MRKGQLGEGKASLMHGTPESPELRLSYLSHIRRLPYLAQPLCLQGKLEGQAGPWIRGIGVNVGLIFISSEEFVSLPETYGAVRAPNPTLDQTEPG